MNEEWLEKYFNVEPYDSTLLENCESEIINKGGHFFLGIIDNEVIGTYALLPTEDGRTELGKMAVTGSYQEKGYGQQLLKHALSTAKSLRIKEIFLFSNRILKNSIYIYKQFGFTDFENVDCPYKRENIKMLVKL